MQRDKVLHFAAGAVVASAAHALTGSLWGWRCPGGGRCRLRPKLGQPRLRTVRRRFQSRVSY